MPTTLELTIRRSADGRRSADARLTSTASVAPAILAANVPIVIDTTALLAESSDPAAYGGRLSSQLFADARLRAAWLKARAYAATDTLQLRLTLDAGDTALHDVRWECLRNPEANQPIALYERVRLVRSLDSADLTPVVLPSRPDLRALVVVGNPANLRAFGLAEVDVDGEVSRARVALGELPATILGDHAEAGGRATLAHIAAALRDTPPIVILVAHGTIRDGMPVVWLEQEDGTADRVTGDTIGETLRRLTTRPLLLVLASCRSAGGGSGDTLRALGPQLAQIGVPAVLAFQGDVTMRTLKTLLPTVITELRRDGQIDRALAAARAALGEHQPWWQAVLWLRTDGRLWREDVAPVRGAGVFQVPYNPNPLFRGRNAELQQVAAALLRNEDGTAAVLPAIAGMGGIGKTQLASEFAYRHRDAFPGGVFWLNMEQPDTIAAQVAAAGGPGGLDLPGWSGMAFGDKVAAVQRAWTEPVRRLIVFDNLEQPALLQDWRPRGGGARVLITTRRGVWLATSGVQPVALQTLARSESVRLLLTPRYRNQVEESLTDPATAQEADAICAQVGDLPLALALAGAYLEQTPSLSLAGYRARLAESLIAHPSLEAELEEGLPTRHATSIAATIALSYQQLNTAKPTDALAVTLLQRMAQLAPAPIPHRLLVRLVEHDPDDEGQAAEVDSPLRRLAALGLIDLLDTGDASLHRLVAAFVRDQDTNAAAHTSQVAAGLIREVSAINEAGYPQAGQSYLVHLQAFATGDKRLEAKQQATLLSNLGYLLRAQGDLAGTRPYLERALAINEQVLGPTHPATATSLNNLGYLLKDQGDLAGARPYLERALAINEQVLGPTHPDTASSLNNLGYLLDAQGDLAGARPYLERALAIREQVLGPTHPDTALSLNNLGTLLEDQGDLAGARLYVERALTIREQVLGPAHPDTALSLNNLGYLLRAQGDLAGAQPYYERALAIYEHVLGPTHPDTAMSLNNLGYLMQAQGDLAGARPYYERALAIREQVLGPTHPDTATSLNNLGYLLRAQGDLAGAQPYYERALAIYEQVLGSTHPDTARSLNNLAALLDAQGDLVRARPYYERALVIREQVLGPTHPDTATSIWWMADLARRMGDWIGARASYERALAIFSDRLGSQHPTTQTVRQHLAALDAAKRT